MNRSQRFEWKLTARHSTSTWQYFVGGEKIAGLDDGGAQPGATVTHRVDFGNKTGRQKVLAVWNIADTTNAFCACIDVNVSQQPRRSGSTTLRPPRPGRAATRPGRGAVHGGRKAAWRGSLA
ncbi:GlcNAc-binding protein A precursor [Streptomyces sp. ADI98-10]|nr:GlcNAc-binding protein A precursor [Streptomyces sp. ADI98-10]